MTIDQPTCEGLRWLLPPVNCPLQVSRSKSNGRFKAEFATKDGARAGAEELKKRFPMLQVRIYDAQTKAREEVELPRA